MTNFEIIIRAPLSENKELLKTSKRRDKINDLIESFLMKENDDDFDWIEELRSLFDFVKEECKHYEESLTMRQQGSKAFLRKTLQGLNQIIVEYDMVDLFMYKWQEFEDHLRQPKDANLVKNMSIKGYIILEDFLPIKEHLLKLSK
jgi:hypothetical protein